jgi:hypothetical protein
MTNISHYIKPISGLSYYVAMIERGVGGFSADVDPDYSRRQIVDEVFECIENGRDIVHVKFINGNDMQDVTDEIVREALALKAKYDRENAELDRIFERQAAERDHARDLRKDEVVS